MELQDAIAGFLFHCQYEKNLSPKTLKAYSIDLRQFSGFLARELQLTTLDKIDKVPLRAYIKTLFGPLREKSIKRKVATLKAFFRHLEREDEIPVSPFRKMDVRIRETKRLPRTVPPEELKKLFQHMYKQLNLDAARDSSAYLTLVRDIALFELLFATGARIAEICGLKEQDVDLNRGCIRIIGKGSRERLLPLSASEALSALALYKTIRPDTHSQSQHFFRNRRSTRLSEQSVRCTLRRHSVAAGLGQAVTPHMFRHSLATLLLEEGLDIRFIQSLLGHASITTTQVYTEIRLSLRDNILSSRHPRYRLRPSS